MANVKDDDLSNDKDISHFASRLTSQAPTSGTAKILFRSEPDGGVVTYTIQLGSVPIPDVTATEIFDYVSPHDLEVYENALFEQEVAALEAVAKAELLAKQRTVKAVAPRQRRISPSSISGRSQSDGNSSSAYIRNNAAPGARSRPTYTQFYPKQRAPRGSKQTTASAAKVVIVKQKAKQSHHKQAANNGKLISSVRQSCTVTYSNTVRQQHSKRLRTDDVRFVSASSNDHDSEDSVYSIDPTDQSKQQPPVREKASDPMDLDSEDSDVMAVDSTPKTNAPSTSAANGGNPTTSTSKGGFFAFRGQAASQPTSTPPNPSIVSSVKQHLSTATAKAMKMMTDTRATTTPLKPALTSGQTTIPVRTGQSLTPRQQLIQVHPPSSSSSDSSSESEDEDEDEQIYTVEKILSHSLSDPRTHDKSVHGTRPVYLYQVKWEGYDELTWEPASSFADDEILKEYWTKHGAHGGKPPSPPRKHVPGNGHKA